MGISEVTESVPRTHDVEEFDGVLSHDEDSKERLRVHGTIVFRGHRFAGKFQRPPGLGLLFPPVVWSLEIPHRGVLKIQLTGREPPGHDEEVISFQCFE